MDFQRNLRRLRKAQGLTLRALAKKANVGYVSVHRIETGKQDATLSMLVKLARGLNVTVAELIGEKPARKRARRRHGT